MKLIPIFHPGRCASTLLEKVLANAGFIHFGEVCQPSNPWVEMLPNGDWSSFSSVDDILFYLSCQATLLAKYDLSLSGITQKQDAFVEFKLNGYGIKPFSDLEKIASSKVVSSCIFLYSQNYLRRLASLYRALQHGQWHVEKTDLSYSPSLVDIDWKMINDGDIFRIVGKPLEEAVEIYRTLMFTQSEVLRQTCASLGKPFIAISFEQLADPGSIESVIQSCLEDIRVENLGENYALCLREAIGRVQIKKTGCDDLLKGFSEGCLHEFMQVPSYESFLPGGSKDLHIPSWY